MSNASPLPVPTVGECLELLADGNTLVRTMNGRWLLSGTVDLRLAWETTEAIADELIRRGYVAELPKRSFRGSVAEYDLTSIGHGARDKVADAWAGRVLDAERRTGDASSPSACRSVKRRHR